MASLHIIYSIYIYYSQFSIRSFYIYTTEAIKQQRKNYTYIYVIIHLNIFPFMALFAIHRVQLQPVYPSVLAHQTTYLFEGRRKLLYFLLLFCLIRYCRSFAHRKLPYFWLKNVYISVFGLSSRDTPAEIVFFFGTSLPADLKIIYDMTKQIVPCRPANNINYAWLTTNSQNGQIRRKRIIAIY